MTAKTWLLSVYPRGQTTVGINAFFLEDKVMGSNEPEA